MRESSMIGEFNNLWRGIRSLAEGLKISVVSQSVRDQALENLLIAKGLVTREEIEEEVKKEATKMVEEAKKAQPTSQLLVPNSTNTPQDLSKLV